MAERSVTGEYFAQIGVTALRNPATGEFLPSEPLYKKVCAEDVDKRTGLARCELDICHDIGGILAEKFGEYIRGCKKEGIKI